MAAYPLPTGKDAASQAEVCLVGPDVCLLVTEEHGPSMWRGTSASPSPACHVLGRVGTLKCVLSANLWHHNLRLQQIKPLFSEMRFQLFTGDKV